MRVCKNEDQAPNVIRIKIVMGVIIVTLLSIAILISSKNIHNKQHQFTTTLPLLSAHKNIPVPTDEPISILKKKVVSVSPPPHNVMTVANQFAASLHHHAGIKNDDSLYMQEVSKKIMFYMQQRLAKEGNQQLCVAASTTRWPAVSIRYNEDSSIQIKLKQTTGSKKLDDIYVQSIKEAFLYSPIPQKLLMTEIPIN